jgi:hypothetical protein
MPDTPPVRPHDNIPSPDPSTITTERLHDLGEQLRREIEHEVAVVTARLDAMDKAMVLFSDNLTRVPTDTDKQVGHLKELHNEKFESIQRQFNERDVRTEQAAIATKIAVDAALQAQKEAAGAQNESNAAAITKSEVATVKQLDSIMALMNSNTKVNDDKFSIINERLNRSEGASVHDRESRSNAHMSSGLAIAITVACFAGATLVLGVLEFVLRAH